MVVTFKQIKCKNYPVSVRKHFNPFKYLCCVIYIFTLFFIIYQPADVSQSVRSIFFFLSWLIHLFTSIFFSHAPKVDSNLNELMFLKQSTNVSCSISSASSRLFNILYARLYIAFEYWL